MSKKTKKALSLIVALSMAAGISLSTAGCGSKDDGNKPADTNATTTTAATEQTLKATDLNFSEQDDPATVGKAWEEVIKDFQAKYPQVTVKKTHAETEGQRTDWQNAVAGGEGPDVISCPHDNIGVFGTAKTAAELDNFFDKSFWDQLDSKVVEDLRFNGKIYGVPYKNGNCLALLYNKKYVTEAPKTMADLVTVSKKLMDDKKVQYGLVFNLVEPFFYIPFLGGFGGQVFDDKGNITLNTDAMKKTSQLLYDLKFTDKIVPKEANYDVASGLFKEGKAAFLINGPWSFKEYKDAKIDLGIARIPQTADGKWPAPYTGQKVLMVNPNVKDDNKKLAVKKFIEFICTPEVQLKLAKASTEFPTNKEALKDSYVQGDPDMKALADQMSVGVAMPFRPEMRAIWDSSRTIFGEVMNGKTKPEEAPAKMQAEAEKQAKSMTGDATTKK